MNDHDHNGVRVTRRGLIVGAVAAAGLAATGTAASANPSRQTAAGPQVDPATSPLLASTKTPSFEVPTYQTTIPGESIEADRVDSPVAPGIVLTTFNTFGRTAGWTRVHVLNADLGTASVGVDLLADEVSETWTIAQTANAQKAVGAVNGDYFDITETFAAEGPEIKGGQLRKGTNQSSTVVTVGADRIARLADLLIQGTVTVAGVQRPLAALNSETVPTDGIDVFTPLWGPGARTLIQSAGPYTELVVTAGKVTAINNQLTDTPVPAGGLIVLGRGAAATQLAGAKLGDAVTVSFQPQDNSPSPVQMALGSGSVLVQNGQALTFPSNPGNDAADGRTAIGWLDDGHRLLLVAVDGKANFSAGLGFDDMATLMVRLGATTAFMLDGGGSTEMVARHAGDSGVSVVNTPSDGNERLVPNAVGLFGAKGSGKLAGLDVRPAADRVVPGLTLNLEVAGYDEAWSAAPIVKHAVKWTATPGSLGKTASDGVFTANKPGAGTLRAQSGSVKGEYDVRVVGDLYRLAFSEPAITIDPGATTSVTLTGFDADGFGAPVASRDVKFAYDKSVLTLKDEADGSVTITGGADANGKAATITATVQGISVTLPVTVGLISISLSEFEPGAAVTWTATSARGSASVATVAAPERPGATADNHALQLTYDFTGQTSTSAAYAVAAPTPITLPSGTKKLSLWVNGDGKGHWLRAMMASQGTTNVPFDFALSVNWTGWQQVIGDIPDGFAEPLTLQRVYAVETSQTNKNAGVLEFDALEALVGQQASTTVPPQPDPYVLEQQPGIESGRWTFAIMSDLHVSAAQTLNSFSARQTAVALDQAVAAKPDFLLINGDFVDDDNPADFVLANGLLAAHVPASLPVYWIPGNHEAGLSSTGGLDAFIAGTGRPTRQIFDHKGTRFILLDSHTGDMRSSDWDQVPLLQSELAKAATDRTVTSVVVSFHHPLVDPTGTGASQLSDQLEASLFQKWLADFRETSGKPIALFTGHVHDAAIRRNDGVLDVTTPAVGKAPMASPDQGGFFGWMLVGVDPKPAKIKAGQPSPDTREWLVAESKPVIDGIQLSAPDQLAVGASATVAATGITSEFGLQFPLRFPASVVWSGSTGLEIAQTTSDVKAAKKKAKTVAVLDLSGDTATLTTVKSGTVTLTVASGGLTASATITVKK
ncbi:phosphodiester glycosidase family protein [Rugosimonospora acidiphila]|uniref:Phosphodiester glycosidase family protein n=1 Tax=Rugosimonospora acidiphila TaxID=556531 RepID=A0ABP9S3I9_9ACTN